MLFFVRLHNTFDKKCHKILFLKNYKVVTFCFLKIFLVILHKLGGIFFFDIVDFIVYNNDCSLLVALRQNIFEQNKEIFLCI